MGFDVFGLEPEEPRGEYFRSNVFYWPGLWAFVTYSCSNIINTEEARIGYFNNGLVIDKARALEIATRLESALKTGEAEAARKSQEEQFPKGPLSMKPLTKLDVREFMEFCRSSGGFTIC